ncbi:MAG: hypothetical protein KJ714_05465 [Euryarchaeota archaeon]|nr:hypothetical protein [Euryarchaeota archaeon]
MSELKMLWKEIEEFVHSHEKEIAEKYIHFLREVAKHYISKGKKVFFRENRVVHYGEGGFGWMVIECDDDEYEVFGGHINEIIFKQKLNEKDIRGCVEIKNDNLEDIKYEL